LSDGGPQFDVYALCPCEPASEPAELVDGGVFLPWPRAKRDACLMACLEARSHDSILAGEGSGGVPPFPALGLALLLGLLLGFFLHKL